MATQSSPQVPVKSKSSNTWIWSIIRGLFALGLGLYLIIASQSAPIVVAYALAIYMLVAGAIQTFMSLLNRRAPGSTTDRIRGLVGLFGAGVLLLLVNFIELSLGAAFTVLAILLVIYGGLGMFEMLFGAPSGPGRSRDQAALERRARSAAENPAAAGSRHRRWPPDSRGPGPGRASEPRP